LIAVQQAYGDKDITQYTAGDYLGLNPTQVDLVSGELNNQNFELVWGFKKNKLSNNLADIESLLDISGLPYEDVQAILDTAFVNPDGVSVIAPDGTLTDLTVDLAERFYRFSRLHAWTDLEIDITDLDLLLGTLDKTAAGPRNLLNNLAALFYLHQDGGFDFDELALWWPTPGQLDREAFAASTGYEAAELALFEALHGPEIDAPHQTRDFWDHIAIVEDIGFTLTQLYDLLNPPYAGSQYAIETADSALLAVQAALLALPEPANGDPDSDLAVQQRIDTVQQTLATLWGVDTALLSVLMSKTDSGQNPLIDALSHAAFPQRESFSAKQQSRMVLLHKQVHLFSLLELNPDDYDSLVEVANQLKVLNPGTLPSAATDEGKLIGRFLNLRDHQAVNTRRFVKDESLFMAVDRYQHEAANLKELRSETGE
jgi:hypothetical protein